MRFQGKVALVQAVAAGLAGKLLSNLRLKVQLLLSTMHVQVLKRKMSVLKSIVNIDKEHCLFKLIYLIEAQ